MKTPRKIPIREALISTLAAVMLIAAQVVVVNHDLAPESHAPDGICELCVAGAGLAGASVGNTPAPVFVGVSFRIPDFARTVHANATRRFHFARAPPAHS